MQKDVIKSNDTFTKEKTTFNLSCKTIDELDDAWMRLRKKLKDEHYRITKTLIVEKAIEIALADLESNNEQSELFLKLKKQD